MKNAKLRNRDLIAMHLRAGGGRHDGEAQGAPRREF
jgi:hypothetical protein